MVPGYDRKFYLVCESRTDPLLYQRCTVLHGEYQNEKKHSVVACMRASNCRRDVPEPLFFRVFRECS